MENNCDPPSFSNTDCFLELSHSSWPISPIRLHFKWLRDHCRCEVCYNAVTFQRKLTLLEMPKELRIMQCVAGNGLLQILWSDGHASDYSVNWLLENNYEYREAAKLNRDDKILWDGKAETLEKFAQVDCDSYMTDDKVANEIVTSLHRYGVAMVHKVPPSEADTERVVHRLFPVHRTLFGDMWTFSDVMTHSDTAYTTSALGAHNDNTYFTSAAGLQILHCLEHSGTGGQTLLIDGYDVARRLRHDDPQSFRRLTQRGVGVRAEYIEQGCHYVATGPVLRLREGSDTDVEQIRFNIYDRAPVTVPSHDVASYYSDMELLSSHIKRPGCELWLKLRPGTVLMFDNWRVLHGRAAYTGHRVMTGCYVSRDDWLSRARTTRE